jgi:hypothetical protein
MSCMLLYRNYECIDLLVCCDMCLFEGRQMMNCYAFVAVEQLTSQISIEHFHIENENIF